MVKFEFRIYEYGWAEICFQHDGDSMRVTASYVSEALTETLKAVIRICAAQSQMAEVDYRREPEVTRLTMTPQKGRSDVRLRFEELDESRPGPLVEMACLRRELANAVRVGAVGIDRATFAEEWPYEPFPAEEIARLAAVEETLPEF